MKAKEGIGLLIGVGPKPGAEEGEDDAEGSDYEPDEAESAAGERLKEVLADKDSSGADIYKAFKRLVSYCGGMGEEK